MFSSDLNKRIFFRASARFPECASVSPPEADAAILFVFVFVGMVNKRFASEGYRLCYAFPIVFFCLLNVICCQLTWMEISFVLITVVFLLFGSLSRSNCVTLVEVSKCRCPGGWRTARLGMFCGMRKNLAPSWIGRNRKHVFWNVWNALFVVVFVLFAWGCLLKASSWCFSLFMLFFVLSQSQTCAARNGLKCK